MTIIETLRELDQNLLSPEEAEGKFGKDALDELCFRGLLGLWEHGYRLSALGSLKLKRETR